MTKERLSREVVVGAAIALADTEGLEALTIRRLATDLGVTPMALYWHFKDKERLLDGVADQLLTEIDLPDDDPASPWDERFRVTLVALLEALRAHPSLVEVVKTRVLASEAGRDLTERALTQLQAGGFSIGQSAQLATNALVTLIALVTAEPGQALATEDEDEREARMREKRATLTALSPKRYPNLVAAAGPLTSCEPDPYFGFGLDVLLEGIRGVSRS